MGVKRIGQGLCWLLLAGMVLCWRPLLAGLPVDNTGMAARPLPSTSPANAAWSLDRLIREWAAIRDSLHA